MEESSGLVARLFSHGTLEVQMMNGSSSAQNEDASQLAEGEGDERDDQKSCHLKGGAGIFRLQATCTGSRMPTCTEFLWPRPLAVAGVTAAAAFSGSFSQSPFKFWFGIAFLPDD